MRLHGKVRKLLQEALMEKDPERAIELFLAARLLYTAYASEGEGELVEKINDKLNALDAKLQSIYERLSFLLEP